ncbi:MAG TPA: DUF465 domain-containing protein [Candidatus Cybelea sp.]|nr:DUF465 domain-containing protein [Candidatus Cybelea sp.]
MAFEAHIDQLVQKHASLEQAILQENQRPHPDDMRIAELKREKLRIKDEIARLAHH